MENRYLTVTALTKYIKRKFDADPHLQKIYVKGEISNFKKHSSGHMYFKLKDEQTRIPAAMFINYNRSLKFLPENGMKVLVEGEVTVYEKDGMYQLYVKKMQPDGIGELFLAFEQLKKKLEKEGLFSPERKKMIPKFPHTIGVVTSPTSAAIRDILTTLKRRYPIGNVLIFPAIVQGDEAPPSIVKAIEQANRMNACDVLIIGRGGGSIEELWAFNEEIVARAIANSKIPTISAVGHETDVTIADFVADKRAPTPTAAAELAAPSIDELLEKILTTKTRLYRAIKEKINLQWERLNRIERSYAFRHPQRIYEQKMEEVDKTTDRLVREMERLFVEKNDQLNMLQQRMKISSPLERVKQSSRQFEQLKKELMRGITNILKLKESQFRQNVATLEALNPLKVMERGYSLVYDENGALVKSVTKVNKEDDVQIQMSDGSLFCKVVEINERSE